MLEPGTALGPYEVLSLLGAGGMGEVYRGRDPRVGRDVAIKVLPPGFATDADRFQRFQREARAIGALNHPNLVTLFDVGSQDGAPFLVMELLDGETLRQKLEGKPLPWKRAAEIARGVAEGLSAAHAQGVLHRDLKPENIFLTREGRTKVLDFGLAKFQGGSGSVEGPTETLSGGVLGTEAGRLLGTAGYMSPEQVRGEVLDPRSDLFSLGILLREMLTGIRPFQKATVVETLHAILREELLELDPGLHVPPVLERIVASCLEKSPAGRFHSAHDLAFALGQFVGESTGTPGADAQLLALRKPWRWPLVSGVVLALAGVLLLGLKLVGHRRFHSERLTPSARIFSSARFLPPNQRSVVYTASFGGPQADIFGDLYRLNAGEPPIALGVRNCRVGVPALRGTPPGAAGWTCRGGCGRGQAGSRAHARYAWDCAQDHARCFYAAR